MESCFPTIALTFKSNSNNNNSSSNINNNNNSVTSKVKDNSSNIKSNTHHKPEIMMGVSETYSINKDVVTPKLQVLEDLDLYYIRQIASSLKELDLEQKIDLEIKMREGSTKLLAACNNMKNATSSKAIGFSTNNSVQNTQILEAAKNLLTSNERMTEYMAELQRRKRVPNNNNSGIKNKSKGKISLSELRIPLMWRDTDHFKNKGDHRRFAVFCLIKIGTDIYDTSLFYPVDRNNTDISFNDVILFSNITPDFELNLEVYSVMMESDFSIASTHKKIKNTIHSSISRTVGKKLAANLKEELTNTNIMGPKFDLIATATLRLVDASDLPHTHDLRLLSVDSGNINSNKLPLFDNFCCRLAVQPDSVENISHADTLMICRKEEMPKLVAYYGRIQNFKLYLWPSVNECESNEEPSLVLELSRETKIKQKSDSELHLCNMNAGKLEKFVIGARNRDDLMRWYTAMLQAIKEHVQWDHITTSEPMPLAIPSNNKQYFSRQSRLSLLYDQLPISAEENIFTKPYRQRTGSTGRSSSSSSSLSGDKISIKSRRSHWPFTTGN